MADLGARRVTETSSPSSVGHLSMVTAGRGVRRISFPHMVCKCGPGSHHAGVKGRFGMLVDWGVGRPKNGY